MRFAAITGLGLFALASAASAQECEGLGLANDFLRDHFCRQIGEILDPEATRSLGSDEVDGFPDGEEPDWFTVGVLQDAYRVDPKKTLELIARIRSAGGLPES